MAKARSPQQCLEAEFTLFHSLFKIPPCIDEISQSIDSAWRQAILWQACLVKPPVLRLAMSFLTFDETIRSPKIR